MKTLRDSLAEYVIVRRAFGTQYREPARTLGHFVAFVESEGVSRRNWLSGAFGAGGAIQNLLEQAFLARRGTSPTAFSQ